VISDDVALKIKIAVENADLAEDLLKKGDVEGAIKNAKVAFGNAEAAFSDPSLLALLYFPDDQKYAVYIPLFLPVMIPVLMSLWTTFNRFRRGNSELAKYLFKRNK
jgi:phosphatidylinositol glycan class S